KSEIRHFPEDGGEAFPAVISRHDIVSALDQLLGDQRRRLAVVLDAENLLLGSAHGSCFSPRSTAERAWMLKGMPPPGSTTRATFAWIICDKSQWARTGQSGINHSGPLGQDSYE